MMAITPSANDGVDLFDKFLEERGHEPPEEWERAYQKKQCPECQGLHDLSASSCSVCGWAPMV